MAIIGIVNNKAPELRVPYWIDSDGKELSNLKLTDIDDGYRILYCFQHWCPGCHSRGFPTLKRLVDRLQDREFGFAVVQTVFEGADQNTRDKLAEAQTRYGLRLPFGHDLPPSGERYPTTMEDYRTAGTPWFIVINPDNDVIYNDFDLNAEHFISTLEREDIHIS
ncbi:MAG: peroxiredoxin family protein [Methyloligellaceae bacterium]